jgi:hypothetical protein
MLSRKGSFRFGKHRRSVAVAKPNLLDPEGDDEGLPEELQGVPVDSKEEARVGVALSIIGWDFRYQVPVFGGTNLRGGQVLDFLVETVPLPTPLPVQSAYWHGPSKKPDDRLNIYQLRSKTSSYWADPKEIWDYECGSIPETVARLVQLIGRP